MTTREPSSVRSAFLPAVTAALAAVGLISTANAQVQVAGALLVDVDVTVAPLGSITAITNNGTMGGFFEALGGGANSPLVAQVSGNGTRGIQFDGDDYMQHVASIGGALVPADPTLVGVNPTCTIEAWVLNPGIAQEETIVSWGHRGGTPDGSNMSFNYGWDDRWGAVGHWGAPDIGWDPCCNSGGNPPGVPKSGVWHHLVYTYDGSAQHVYADGVLKNSETVGLNIFPTPPITIAAQMADDAIVEPALRGALTIGRLRVHSEALSDAQVLNNYNYEAADFSTGGSPLPFGPSHRYSFSNPAGAAPDGSVVTDSIGGANGVIHGAGANFTGSRVTLPGGSSTVASYIDLPNGLLSANSTDNGGSGGVTFEGWVKVTGGRTWSRVLDFGSSDIDPTAALVGGEVTGAGGGGEGLDYLFLSAQEGDNVNRHVVDIRNADPAPGTDPVGPGFDSGNFNRDYHYALTWDEATGEILVYENGAQIASMSATGTRMSDIHDVNCWLGRSNWTGDQNMQGEFDEFRIYPRVVPPDQLRASYNAGPDSLATEDPVSIVTSPMSQSIPEFGNVAFSVIAQGAPPIALQWYKNGSPLVGSNGNSISYSSVPLSEDGSRYFVIASNNIGGTSFYATSGVAILTVLADTNPPTILQVRVDGTTQIEVVFSEPILMADAANPNNFSLTGPAAPTITQSAPGSDAARVILTLSGPLTPCEFYVVSVTGVHDLSVAANVTPPGTISSFWNYALPGLTHRYTFNYPPTANATDAAVPDAVGTADGTVKSGGGSTTFNGSQVTLSGGSSATSPYVDLPNGLLSVNSTNNGGSGKVTLEGWVKVTGAKNWGRIFDFGDSAFAEVPGPGGGGEGRDYFMLSASVGTDVNNRRLELRNEDPGGGGIATVDYNTSTFNQSAHFVVTWDEATGRIRAYENGVEKTTMVVDDAMSDINDVNVWLGRSNWTGDENMQGEFDDFRIYNSILGLSDVQRNFAAGPDNNFGSLLALNLAPATNNMVTNTIATVRVLASFSTVGTQNVASSGCVLYSSSDSNVVYITSDGVIHAGNAGTATVTATLSGFSDAEVIEVTQDATPPSLLSARANSARLIEITFSEPVDPVTGAESGNYEVFGPSGPIVVSTAQLQADQSHVVLTLDGSMPCEYITVLVSYVADQSPLFNQIALNSPVSFMNFVQAGMQHRYTFNGSGSAPSGTVVPDGVGTADGVILGSGGMFTGDSVNIPGGSSATAAYVDLPNGLLSANGVVNGGSGKVSLETWVRVTGSRAWSRIFDFGSSGPCCSPGGEVTGPGGGGEGIDYFMLSAEVDTDVNARRLELLNREENNLGNLTTDYATTNFNYMAHIVVTWDEPTQTILVYENGALVKSATTVAPMSSINDVNVWLGRSNWTGDQNMQGDFDEFRIYNRVLSQAEIVFNGTIGSDNTLGRPQAVRISAPPTVPSGQVITPVVFADFTSVSNVDLTGTACYTLESSNPSVAAVGASGTFNAVGTGTADLIVRMSGLSNSTPVTVTSGGGNSGTITLQISGGTYTLTFLGTPGVTYRIQRANDLTTPVQWNTTLTTQMAPASGIITVQDPNPPAGQAFYRAVSP